MTDKPVPVIRANAYDIDVYLSLRAAFLECERAAANMEKRIRAAPKGWWHIRSVSYHLRALTEGLKLTFPVEKRRTLKTMERNCSYKIYHGPQAGQLETNEAIVHDDDLNVLTHFAHEQCKICFDGKCNRCPLGKALDHILTYDREEDSWSNVDFNAVFK